MDVSQLGQLPPPVDKAWVRTRRIRITLAAVAAITVLIAVLLVTSGGPTCGVTHRDNVDIAIEPSSRIEFCLSGIPRFIPDGRRMDISVEVTNTAAEVRRLTAAFDVVRLGGLALDSASGGCGGLEVVPTESVATAAPGDTASFVFTIDNPMNCRFKGMWTVDVWTDAASRPAVQAQVVTAFRAPFYRSVSFFVILGIIGLLAAFGLIMMRKVKQAAREPLRDPVQLKPKR